MFIQKVHYSWHGELSKVSPIILNIQIKCERRALGAKELPWQMHWSLLVLTGIKATAPLKSCTVKNVLSANSHTEKDNWPKSFQFTWVWSARTLSVETDVPKWNPKNLIKNLARINRYCVNSPFRHLTGWGDKHLQLGSHRVGKNLTEPEYSGWLHGYQNRSVSIWKGQGQATISHYIIWLYFML